MSWEAASSRLEQAKAQIAERGTEDERKRREEEEKLNFSQPTAEVYPDSDADLEEE